MPPPADDVPPSQVVVSTNQPPSDDKEMDVVRGYILESRRMPASVRNKLFCHRLGVYLAGPTFGCHIGFDAVFETDYDRCRMRRALRDATRIGWYDPQAWEMEEQAHCCTMGTRRECMFGRSEMRATVIDTLVDEEEHEAWIARQAARRSAEHVLTDE